MAFRFSGTLGMALWFTAENQRQRETRSLQGHPGWLKAIAVAAEHSSEPRPGQAYIF